MHNVLNIPYGKKTHLRFRGREDEFLDHKGQECPSSKPRTPVNPPDMQASPTLSNEGRKNPLPSSPQAGKRPVVTTERGPNETDCSMLQSKHCLHACRPVRENRRQGR